MDGSTVREDDAVDDVEAEPRWCLPRPSSSDVGAMASKSRPSFSAGITRPSLCTEIATSLGVPCAATWIDELADPCSTAFVTRFVSASAMRLESHSPRSPPAASTRTSLSGCDAVTSATTSLMTASRSTGPISIGMPTPNRSRAKSRRSDTRLFIVFVLAAILPTRSRWGSLSSSASSRRPTDIIVAFSGERRSWPRMAMNRSFA